MYGPPNGKGAKFANFSGPGSSLAAQNRILIQAVGSFTFYSMLLIREAACDDKCHISITTPFIWGS